MSILRPNRRRDRNDDPKGKEFMLWVKGKPCVVCSRGWPSPNPKSVEFMHIGGNIAAKASNMHGLPGCTYHHRGAKYCQENLKGQFGAYYGFDVEREIDKLVAEFEGLSAPTG